ncbi:MAG: hypothetical protein HYY52_05020 [Candidatus Melainabacteria bacterium]|nr:hypothetical protein [Candidatus Melainabacteria bacterium]
MSSKVLADPIGEVISSSNELVIAQCYKGIITSKNQKHAISLSQGSTVKVVSSYDNSHIAFGLITKINNTSLDNIHRPSALGLSSKELEELQPQVYDLLKKELEIYLFSYKSKEAGSMMIHDFVYKTSEDEVLSLTESFTSLINTIKKNQIKPDILVNLIQEGYRLRNNDYGYLLNIGKEITLAFSLEIDSLFLLLKRISPSE